MTFTEKTMCGFVSVFLSSALWPSLPPISLIAWCSLVLFFALLVYLSTNQRRALLAWPIGIACGAGWAVVVAHMYLTWQVPPALFYKNVIVQGTVSSLMPAHSTPNTSVSFILKVDTAGMQNLRFSPKIRVSWFMPSLHLQQGQRVRLFVNLKPPVGLANRHGFHFQTWLASQNIAALAYVKSSPSNYIIQREISWRQSLVNKLQNSELSHKHWIAALTYADRSGFTDANWSLLQNTATAHLFAISGMHLGLVFALVLGLLKCVLLLAPNSLTFQQRILKWKIMLLALLCCGVYAWLAGFQVPVLRALCSVILIVLCAIKHIHWRLSSYLLCLLTLFCVCFPYAHLSVSYWFSFGAVLLIFLFLWRFPAAQQASLWQKVKYVIALQLFLSFCMLPITLFTFNMVPIVGVFANLLMIPFVSFVLVPSCLFVAVMSMIFTDVAWLWTALNTLFIYSISILTLFDRVDVVSSTAWNVKLWQLVALAVLMLIITLPRWPHKRPLMIILISLYLLTLGPIYYFRGHYMQPHWQLFVFDVGQGSAMVIQKQGRFIIYDTGAKPAQGISMAKRVLLPFFEHQYNPKIDKLILSHLDNDHAGGATELIEFLNIDSIISPADGCNTPHQFIWQGLIFEILWPLSPQSGEQNNHSCVIRVSDGKHSVLLSGDIEGAAETALLRQYVNDDVNTLASTILIAPHHGSSTSSSNAFVKAVNAQHVIFSAGFANRWQFPHAGVLMRYKRTHAKTLTTGTSGQITFTFTPHHYEVSQYREHEYKRWHYATPAR
ncbi:MAG: DNA internalization-related competence protein ComEC/Rec2 [Glaciecola sp.]